MFYLFHGSVKKFSQFSKKKDLHTSLSCIKAKVAIKCLKKKKKKNFLSAENRLNAEWVKCWVKALHFCPRGIGEQGDGLLAKQ